MASATFLVDLVAAVQRNPAEAEVLECRGCFFCGGPEDKLLWAALLLARRKPTPQLEEIERALAVAAEQLGISMPSLHADALKVLHAWRLWRIRHTARRFLGKHREKTSDCGSQSDSEERQLRLEIEQLQGELEGKPSEHEPTEPDLELDLIDEDPWQAPLLDQQPTLEWGPPSETEQPTLADSTAETMPDPVPEAETGQPTGADPEADRPLEAHVSDAKTSQLEATTSECPGLNAYLTFTGEVMAKPPVKTLPRAAR